MAAHCARSYFDDFRADRCRRACSSAAGVRCCGAARGPRRARRHPCAWPRRLSATPRRLAHTTASRRADILATAGALALRSAMCRIAVKNETGLPIRAGSPPTDIAPRTSAPRFGSPNWCASRRGSRSETYRYIINSSGVGGVQIVGDPATESPSSGGKRGHDGGHDRTPRCRDGRNSLRLASAGVLGPADRARRRPIRA